jgi:hypothetical protein
MNRNTLLSLLAGLAGGLAVHYTAPPTAFAQDQAPVTKPATKEVRAQSFVLVDSSNHALGTFTAEPRPGFGPLARIVLRDSGGKEIWSAGGTSVQPLSLK